MKTSPWTRLERALHRPRPCPECAIPSTEIIDGRCLACRDDLEHTSTIEKPA